MTIAIIGAGNVGLALAAGLRIAAGENSVVLGSRDTAATAQKIRAIDHIGLNGIQILEPSAAVREATLVLMCVPDTKIAQLTKQLRPYFSAHAIIAHCSGALSSDILRTPNADASTEAARHLVCSLHPLNTFPNPLAALAWIERPNHGTALICEGDAAALEKITPLFNNIGFVSQTINAQAKPLYHAASVMVCNYLSVLMNAGLEISAAAGMEPAKFWRAAQPLINATLTNISEQGAPASLSGPIARGDAATVATHLSELQNHTPNVSALYRELGANAVAIMRARADLNEEALNELARVLNSNLTKK